MTIKQKNAAMKAKAKEADEAAEENEEEEEEEETSGKKSKGKKEKKEKPAKGKAAKDEKPSANGVLKKLKDREKGGAKTKLLNLIPKKGISMKDLKAASEELGLSSKKVESFVAGLQKNGYISK